MQTEAKMPTASNSTLLTNMMENVPNGIENGFPELQKELEVAATGICGKRKLVREGLRTQLRFGDKFGSNQPEREAADTQLFKAGGHAIHFEAKCSILCFFIVEGYFTGPWLHQISQWT